MSDHNRPAVCIVGHKYYPEHNHLRRDAEALVEAGYDVNLVMLRHAGEAAHETIGGVHVYRLPIEHRRGSWRRYAWEYALFLTLAFLTVSWLHLRKRLRVVEVVNMPDVLVFTALFAKLTGARVILYIFDNMPELYALTRGCGPGHPVVRALAFLEAACARFADRVIVTQEVARRLVESRGIPRTKLSVVLNGPDERIFRRNGRPNGFSGHDDTLEIVTHGLLLERFGVHLLIDALPKIAAEIPRVRVRVIGDGEYRPELEALARRRGVSELVDFRDWVPVHDLLDYLARADIGYVGMLCDNMLSNKLMEYVALGVPVVLARWPVYEHYFPDDAVRYVEPGSVDDVVQAVLELARDPERARRHAERASLLYQNFRWASQRQQYLGIYGDLAADRATRATSDARSVAP